MDRIASFGPSLTDDGITGNLQVAIHNGCQAVPPPCDNWIALVERGNCTFIDKVRFMQQSNAKAVIVGDRYSSSWVSMYTSGKPSQEARVLSV
jgi:E3 ubiquitin-protein ligase RNF13